MKKLIVPVLFGIALLLHPFDLFAKNYCLTDGFSFFVLSKGKVNQKPFAGKFVNGNCQGTLWASVVSNGIGTVALMIEGNIPSPCVNFIIEATGDSNLTSSSGIFDNSENATSDGSVTLTPVSCSSVPSAPQAMRPAKRGIRSAGMAEN